MLIQDDPILIRIFSFKKKPLTISSILEHPFLAVQITATMTPPLNMRHRKMKSFQPWSLRVTKFLAVGSLATSAVETPKRDALRRIALRRRVAFSQATFDGLAFNDLVFACAWFVRASVSCIDKVYVCVYKHIQLCTKTQAHCNMHAHAHTKLHREAIAGSSSFGFALAAPVLRQSASSIANNLIHLVAIYLSPASGQIMLIVSAFR